MIRNRLIVLTSFIFIISSIPAIGGCSLSSGNDPIDPGLIGYTEFSDPGNSHPCTECNRTELWGLWDISINHMTLEVTVTPMRSAEFQANITRFLQPPSSQVNLLTIQLKPAESDFLNGYVVCNLTVAHPFPGTEFWGFDTRGIIMGTLSGEVEIENFDGFTRWWNPLEFTTVGKIFGYTEGFYSNAPTSTLSTIHPFKYFADSLQPEDTFIIDPATRGTFSASAAGSVSRRYEIQFPMVGNKPKFHFRYAITASWQNPTGDQPYELADFALTANQAEAYRIQIEDNGSTLYKTSTEAGGDLLLSITVYDWQMPQNPSGMMGELAELYLGCDNLGLVPVDVLSLPDTGVSPGPDINSETYSVIISGLIPSQAGPAELWVKAVSANVTSYAPDIPGITGFDYPDDPLAAYNCGIVIVAGEIPDGIYVDDSSTELTETGSMFYPFKTISAAMAVAVSGDTILVDDSGNEYAEEVSLAGGVTLLSSNWDASDGTDRAVIKAPAVGMTSAVKVGNVAGATISGFDLRLNNLAPVTGYQNLTFIFVTDAIDLTVTNCYFHGNANQRSNYGLRISGGSGIEIGNCHFEHLYGQYDPPPPYLERDHCVYAENSPGIYIHNNRMNDLGTNYNENGISVDAVWLTACDDPVIHNNVVYKLVLTSGGLGSGMTTGFYLQDSSNPVIYNNTVNMLDTTDNFMINQAFAYDLDNCANGIFYNNIAANISASGWPGILNKGVLSGLTLPCNYTLVWNVAEPYSGSAYANTGCVSTNPLFIDPDNGLHDLSLTSDGQLGDPSNVDWDDTGAPSNDPLNTDINTRSRMGCHGGPGGETVGLLD